MMRRTPLKRGKPLRRKGRLRARSKTNSYRKRERFLEHMRKVRRLPCMVRAWARILFRVANGEEFVDSFDGPESSDLRKLLYKRHALACMTVTTCSGRIQVDHVGERAYGKICPDDETVAMCRKHHGERTGEPVWSTTKNTFSAFNAEEMRAWCEWALRVTHRELEDMDCHTAALDSSSL